MRFVLLDTFDLSTAGCVMNCDNEIRLDSVHTGGIRIAPGHGSRQFLSERSDAQLL